VSNGDATLSVQSVQCHKVTLTTNLRTLMKNDFLKMKYKTYNVEINIYET